MAGPIGTRLAKLERRLGVGTSAVPGGDDDDDYVNPLSPEQQARLEELEAKQRRRRLANRLGREPSDAEMAAEAAAEVARSEAMVAADAKRRAEMGMPPAPKRMGPGARQQLDRLMEN
jgi:hypothetical protein